MINAKPILGNGIGTFWVIYPAYRRPAIFHIEGAEAIDENLDSLHLFHAMGLRSLGPVWSRPTVFGHGVPFRFPSSPDTGPGLTDLGFDLIRACNRLGILIDLAHITEKGFWDVERLSDQPLIASHSNVHALTPVARNLTDRQLDAIRTNEHRVGFLGVDPWRYKLGAFVGAACIAGTSGALYPMLRGFVSPELMFVQVSGNAVINVIVGGTGTLIGALYGSAILTVLRSVIGTFTAHHQLVIGVIFMISVIFFPKGLIGYVLEALERRHANREKSS